MSLKVSTWNVNGIRARYSEVLDWIAREQPDVLCLQEIKAAPEKVPPEVCSLAGYWCYWHGHKGYSGVGLHLRRDAFPEQPDFVHPGFDHETRIVTARAGNLIFASIYVPNGNKDYPAKVRFLEALDGYAAGPNQSLENPLGVRGPELFEWFFSTRTWKQMHGEEGGSTGVDNEWAERGMQNVGAW